LIFPFIQDNQTTYFSNRFIDDSKTFGEKNRRFANLSGVSKKLYYWDLNHSKVYLFEGIIDALSYYQLTGNDNFIATSQIIGKDSIEKINELTKAKIIIVSDLDEPGKEALKAIVKEYKDLSFFDFDNYLRTKYPALKPKIKDFNDYLQYLHDDFIERASIMEFDGNLSRSQAEAEAMKITGYRR
ncbi:MAG: toprim domain-containing protein, partial [Candidatus Cloacimonetes bacterium]|nr:toprim domain-containing protein [Candidatus Cloacimonadota bacterium]